MVYDLAEAYEASDDKENFRPKRKTHKERSGAIWTPEFAADVEIVKGYPNKSIREIAKEMGTSRGTIGRTVKEDLNFKSYKLRRRQLLTHLSAEGEEEAEGVRQP